MEAPQIPDMLDVSTFDPQLDLDDDIVSETSPSPRPFRLTQPDVDAFGIKLHSENNGPSSRTDSSALSIVSQPSSPTKDPTKRRGMIVNMPLLIPNIHRTPSCESIAECGEQNVDTETSRPSSSSGFPPDSGSDFGTEEYATHEVIGTGATDEVGNSYPNRVPKN